MAGLKVGIPLFGCDGGRSGIGRYCMQMLEQFVRQEPGHRYEVIGSADDVALFAGGLPGVTSTVVPGRYCGTMANLAWHQASLPLWSARRGLDVVFLPAANRRLPFAMPCPTVGTVHDLSSLHVAAKYDRTHRLYITRVLPALVRRLSRVITVSESSRRDIVDYARVPEERIQVIPNGVDLACYKPQPPMETKKVLAGHVPVDRPYILYVSRIEHPGKNHMRLIEAFCRFKESTGLPHRLILAGSDRERAEEVHEAADRCSAAQDIWFTGYLEEQLLPALYAGADLFAFPSLYEGFGIPLLEAMACDVPVACANSSSLPEVAGEAAVFFDPTSVADIAKSMQVLATRPQERARCVEAGRRRCGQFSWENAGRQTLDVLESAGGRPGPAALSAGPAL